MQFDSLTMVIPTQNRPRYLERALAYYRTTACPFRIMICDSSEADKAADVASIVAGCGLDVELRQFTHGLPIHVKLLQCVQAVPSGIIVFAADDDFIVPGSIRQCAEFLHSHADFSVAHGRAYTFAVAGAGVHGPIVSIRPYRQLASIDARPRQRLVTHFRDWSTSFYSVQRTAQVLETLEGFARLRYDVSACEVYFYARNAILGKAAKLDCNYMYRQLDVSKQHVSFDTHIWADAEGWEPIRDALVREIAVELERAGGETIDHGVGFVSDLLRQWVESRRPFGFRRWRSYPLRYYWERTQNLGHKAGLRMREFWRPSAEGRIVRALVEGAA
jgi:glycosyltransferase domain-containing protein